MHYNYILRNLNNDRYYYGASSSKHRRRTHFTKLKMGKHHSPEMQADYNAGHKFTFSVIKEFSSRKEAFAFELQTIIDCLDDPLCYNRTLKGYKQSDSHIRNRIKSKGAFKPSPRVISIFERANAARRKSISIKGVVYTSILEASIALKIIRPTIRKRLNSDLPEYADWKYVK